MVPLPVERNASLPLTWPGPLKELTRARFEAKRDPAILAITRHAAELSAQPKVRAAWYPTVRGQWEPQPPCGRVRAIDELQAPLFIAAEQPSRIAAGKAPFGMRMGGKSEAEMDAGIRRYLANASQPRQCRYRSCAVVGSSGALRGGQLGSTIDAHEAVIRINAAPTHAYEEAVGRRTTWRVHNSEKPYMLAASGLPELQVAICHMGWIGSCQHQAFSGAYTSTLAYINPRFYRRARLTSPRITSPDLT